MPAHSMEAAFREELAQLKAGYLAQLPAEFTALTAMAAALRPGEAGRPDLDALHHRLHKLTGSGGTFGLDGLSREARRLERLARTWLADATPEPSAQTLEEFARAVADLPASLERDLRQPPPPMTLPADARPPGRLVHIWLVEDDSRLGDELVRLLGQFGYDARLFTRLDLAAAALTGGLPDVLVMDVLFPAEGLNATQVALEDPLFRALDCPILFISGQDDFASRARAARRGAAGYLTKPVDLAKLVDRLERIVEERHAAPYRVLIVDDDRTLAQHYRLVLNAAGMEAETLGAPEAILDALTAFQPELVLMDMHMPGHTGPELAAVIRQHDEWLGLPIVYLSAETDLDEQLRAMDQGADDFLTKPISDTQLRTAVRVRADRSRQLAELMSKDSLTGLLKHTRFKEILEMEHQRALRSGKPYCVAMVDIDHFKQVNDTYGHAAGDQVIKTLARLLRQRLRKTDSIGRYGGEEFAVVLPECDGAAGLALLDDIRRHFGELRFQHAGQVFDRTLSAGLACNTELPGLSAGDLLIAADQALYSAKHGGRDQVRLAAPAAP